MNLQDNTLRKSDIEYSYTCTKYEQIKYHFNQLFGIFKNHKNIYISHTTDYKVLNLHDKCKISNFDDFYINQMINRNEFEDRNYYTSPVIYRYIDNEISKKKLHIEAFSAIIIDIDERSMDAEEYVEMLEENNFFDTVLRPSYFINSGNGVYAVYLLNYVTGLNSNMVYSYSKVKNILYDIYKADRKSRETNHTYRMPGTTNYKENDTESYILDFDNIKYHDAKRYTFTELADSLGYTKEYIKAFREKYALIKAEKVLKRKNKVYDLNAIKSKKTNSKSGFYYISSLRVHDIRYLVNSRSIAGYDFDGMRHDLLLSFSIYLFYSNYKRFKQESEELINDVYIQVIALNNQMENQRLDITRIDKIVDCALTSLKNLVKVNGIKQFNTTDGIYYHNTDTLRNIFNVTSDEDKYMHQLLPESTRKRTNDENRNSNKRTQRRDKNGIPDKGFYWA